MKKLKDSKLEVVKPALSLHFTDSLGQRGISIYVAKISEALNAGAAVKISSKDQYLRSQLQQAAKKLNVRLVYALDGDFLYVKPLAIEGEKKRLVLLLRESRSLNELKGKNLELHLENTLAELAKEGLAHLHKEKWVLTAKGLDTL
jgi:hypothetical protein